MGIHLWAPDITEVSVARTDREARVAPQSREPAAQYVRMSTEHQRYSTDNQAKVIASTPRSEGLRSFGLTPTKGRVDFCWPIAMAYND